MNLLEPLLEQDTLGVASLDLSEAYSYEEQLMDFTADQLDEKTLSALWGQDQKYSDTPEASVPSEDDFGINEESLARALARPSSSISSNPRRNSSIAFVNPFYGDDDVDQEEVIYTIPPIVCSHGDERSGSIEDVEQILSSWPRYPRPSLPNHLHVPQVRDLYNSPVASHPSTINAQISRRYSLACPPSSGMGVPVANSFGQIPGSSNIQFVMEDPSGKDKPLPLDSSALDAGRRHSVGASHLYCCPWSGCNKVFNRFYNLRSHYRIHSGEKPFTCNCCDASFARNHDLKRHERIHSKAKPYVCSNCNKQFSRTDALNRHTRLNSCNRIGV